MSSLLDELKDKSQWLIVSLPLLSVVLYGLSIDFSEDLPDHPCVNGTKVSCRPVGPFAKKLVTIYVTIALMALLVGTALLNGLFYMKEQKDEIHRAILRRLGTLGFLLGAFVTGSLNTPNSIGAFSILAVPRLVELSHTFMESTDKISEMYIPHLIMGATATVATGVLAFEYEGEVEWSGAAFGASIVSLGCAYRAFDWGGKPLITGALETVALFGSTVLGFLAAHFFESSQHEFVWIMVGGISLAVYAASIGDARDSESSGEKLKPMDWAYILGAFVVLGIYVGAYLDFGEVDWEKGGRTTDLLEKAMALNVGISFAYFYAVVASILRGVKGNVFGVVRIFAAIMLSVQVGGSVIHEVHDQVDMSASEIVSIVLFATLFLASSAWIEFKNQNVDEQLRAPAMLSATLGMLVVILGFVTAMSGKEKERIDFDPPDHAAQYTFMILVVVLSIVYAIHFPLRKQIKMIRYVTPLVEGSLVGLLAAYIGFDYVDDSGYRHLTTKTVLIAFVHILLAIRLDTPGKLEEDSGPTLMRFNFWDRYSTKV